MEVLLQLVGPSPLGIIVVMAVIVSVITQVLKNILPERLRTRVLVLFVSIFVVFGYSLATLPITAVMIFNSICSSFIVAFISMFGFDSLKDVIKRCGGGESEQ